MLALKVVAVTNERWWPTRVSKCSDMTWKRLVFGELVADEGGSLKRGGCNRQFDCSDEKAASY